MAAVVEVIEHLDASRLISFEKVLFKWARPKHVVITTPNTEYNPKFINPKKLRHADHRFEWTRHEFEAWACKVAETHGYKVAFFPVGPVDQALGAPTQMGVFSRGD